MDAVETLMQEHRVIEGVLGSLEAYVEALEHGADPRTLGQYAEFFQGYADKVHHGKEEDILFGVMGRRGFSREAGPLAVMLHDHEQGRAAVSLLAQGGRTGQLSGPERAELSSVARRYARVLRHHIYKEDTILFSMAEGQLKASDWQVVEKSFERFASERSPAPFEALAERLRQQYPPVQPSVDAAEPFGNGCDLHCTLAGCAVRDAWSEPDFNGM
jgi:hemerythrin-like domain-containing protein